MTSLRGPRWTRAGLLGSGSVVALGTLVGCQAYERAPLDLASHKVALDARLTHTEPLTRFAERLSRHDGAVPDRFDPTDGLTRAEGEVLALFYNADLRRARLDAGVARATYETAGLWEDPQFGFDGAEVLSPAGPFEYGVTLSLTIPVSGRLGVEKDRAGAAYEAELRRIVDAEWRTRAQVRSAWSAWSVASERRALLQGAIDQIERIGSITDRLATAGELARTEARMLRLELASLRGRLIAIERAEGRARLDLLGLLGLPPDTTVELRPDISAPPLPAVEDVAARLIEANTLLATRRAEYRAAEESLRLEIRRQYPDITIGAGLGSEDRDDRLLLGVSIPIPILNANRQGIAEARARRASARAAAELAFERLARELALARAELMAARRHATTVEDELVPLLEQQTRELEALADLGEVDTLVLLETVTRSLDAKTTLLELRLDEVRAAIELVRLLGPAEPARPLPVDENDDHACGDTTDAARHTEQAGEANR